MDQIILQAEHSNQVTCISNIFIDEYMPSANGEYVKLYLYLLRCLTVPGMDCSLTHIADIFECSLRDLNRALVYWERMGLLELTYNNEMLLCGITLLDITHHTTPPDFPKKTVVTPEITKEPEVASKAVRKEYTKDEIKSFSDREDVCELIFIAEHYLQKPLTHTELHSILYWYDSLHFSLDLIEYLIEYCVGREHKSIRYMDKVALSWSDAGISTVEQAKKNANLYSQANYAVIKALGIKGRNLIESETVMIQKWTNEFQFSLDIITEACSRTINTTHQPSFDYTDKILTNWYNANVKELSDIEKLDQNYQKTKKSSEKNNPRSISQGYVAKTSTNRFNNFSQRTYDYEKLEQQMLNRNRN